MEREDWTKAFDIFKKMALSVVEHPAIQSAPTANGKSCLINSVPTANGKSCLINSVPTANGRSCSSS